MEARKLIQDILANTNTLNPLELARGAAKIQALKQLNEAISKCNVCNVNSKHKTIAFGNPNASVMIIGDCITELQSMNNELSILAPYEKTPERESFTRLFHDWNINPGALFWINTVNCAVTWNGSYRCSNSSEIQKCSVFMKNAIDIIHPSVVILLGAIALSSFSNEPMNKAHGKWIHAYTIPAMPVYSPTYLSQLAEIQDPDIVKTMKIDMINDLKSVFSFINSTYPNSNVFLKRKEEINL